MASLLAYTSADQIPAIHQKLKATFMSGKTRTLEFRREQLHKLGLAIQNHEEEWCQALATDLKRPRNEAFAAEITGLKAEIAEALKHLKSWMKPKSVSTTFVWKGTFPKIYRDPKGTVLIIGTWNYPLALSIGPLVGAIAGGNTAILKPSEGAPATATLIHRLITQYLDPEAFVVVNGAIQQTSALLDLPFDHIFYTGSGKVGRIVAEKAAKHLTPTTLELGGKSPCVIGEGANIKVAASRIAWGKVVNAAQTCIAPDYILVPSAQLTEFTAAFQEALNTFYRGPNQLDSPDYSKMIHVQHYSKIESMLGETKGQILVGGKSDKEALKIETTLVHCKNDDALMREEIFGPLLPILTYETKDEAINIINSRDVPLSLYVFGNSALKDYILQRTRSGSLVHNDVLVQFIVPGLPFGGTGPAGYGNYHGKASFDCFTHERSTLSVPPMFETILKSRYPPYTPGKLRLMTMFGGGKIPARL